MEDREKILKFKEALDNLEGVPIPYNIIKHHFGPIRTWLAAELAD